MRSIRCSQRQSQIKATSKWLQGLEIEYLIFCRRRTCIRVRIGSRWVLFSERPWWSNPSKKSGLEIPSSNISNRQHKKILLCLRIRSSSMNSFYTWINSTKMIDSPKYLNCKDSSALANRLRRRTKKWDTSRIRMKNTISRREGWCMPTLWRELSILSSSRAKSRRGKAIRKWIRESSSMRLLSCSWRAIKTQL